jgi:hypothetical protein
MKKVIFLFLIILTASVYCKDELKVKSKVVEATIFKNRALITREGKINLPKGKSVIFFSNLPVDLQNSSVRVSADGKGVIKILDVKVEQRFTTEVQQEDIKTLENKIDSLNQLIQISSDEINILDSKKDFIESLKSQSARYMNEKMLLQVNPTKEWGGILNFVDKNLEEIYKGLRIQSRKKKFYQQQINVLNAELYKNKGKKSKNFKEVIVTIETETAGNVKLRPSYLVQSAGWYPLYDARIASATKECELDYYGMVHQSTGEDWKDVSLTLSTAEPMSVKSLPELDRWFINTRPLIMRRPQPEIRGGQSGELQINYEQNWGLPAGTGNVTGYVIDKSTGEALVGANVLVEGTSMGSSTDANGRFLINNIPQGRHNLKITYIGYQARRISINIAEKSIANISVPLNEASIQTHEVTVTAERPLVQKNATNAIRVMNSEYISPQAGVVSKQVHYTNVYAKELSTSFEVPAKTSIPSDNSEHKVTISMETLPVEFTYTSIPKISPSVYLRGKIVNKNNYPLLEGDINIFVDNDFINRTYLKTIVPSDTLSLALGIDNSIQIKKVLINKFTESKGLLGGSRQITYNYEIQITNNRKTEETVKVYDQAPIAMNEDIKVELLEPKIDMDKLSNDRELKWYVKLKPGEKKIIPLKYTIEFPNKVNVYGLE